MLVDQLVQRIPVGPRCVACGSVDEERLQSHATGRRMPRIDVYPCPVVADLLLDLSLGSSDREMCSHSEQVIDASKKDVSNLQAVLEHAQTNDLLPHLQLKFLYERAASESSASVNQGEE